MTQSNELRPREANNPAIWLQTEAAPSNSLPTALMNGSFTPTGWESGECRLKARFHRGDAHSWTRCCRGTIGED